MRYIAALIITGLLWGCYTFESADKYKEGIIEYGISYTENQITKYPSIILPKKMTLTFNHRLSLIVIESFMGFFKLENLTNFYSKKCTSHLKILNKKYIFNGGRNEMMCCFDAMEDMRIDYLDDTKTIAGLECKKAMIILECRDPFPVYYTEEIGIRNPNATNPYYMIEGILMQFPLQMGPFWMTFTATSFENTEIKNKDIAISNEAKTVTRDEMTYVVNKLLE